MNDHAVADVRTLVDAERLHAEHPRGVRVPARRFELYPGELVKLAFERTERRFWVEVVTTSADAEGGIRYEGRVADDPSRIEGLAFGDLLRFEPRNVLRIRSEQ